MLPSWNLTAARDAIEGFVETVTRNGSPDFVAPAERIAVFDTDGTLWCEQPMPLELGFIFQRLAAMAEAAPALRGRQPWRAAYTRDYGWLGRALTRHYQGDDAEAKVLMAGMLQAFRGWPVEDYEREADAFLHHARHPTLHRGLAECGYQPMVELLRYLEANGFSCYLAAGGDRDFMRALAEAIYGIPPERVIGSAAALRYREGPEGGAWSSGACPRCSTTGRRSRCGSGAGSDGARPGGRKLQRRHPHAGLRRRARPAGAPAPPPARRRGPGVRVCRRCRAGPRARPRRGWTVVSIRHDWGTVFAEAPALALR